MLGHQQATNSAGLMDSRLGRLLRGDWSGLSSPLPSPSHSSHVSIESASQRTGSAGKVRPTMLVPSCPWTAGLARKTRRDTHGNVANTCCPMTTYSLPVCVG